MKNIKKLIPAFCMLLVSVVLLGSSTYAWFSMNRTVKTDGLDITAKADYVYLLAIEKNTTTAKDATTALDTMQKAPDSYTSVTFTAPTNTTLSPAAPKAAVTGAPTAAVVGNWYTAEGQSTSDGTKKDGTDHDLTAAGGTDAYAFDKYVIKKTMYLTLAKDSSGTKLKVALNDMTATGAATATDLSAIKVMIVCGDKKIELSNDAKTSTEVLATLSNTAAVEVDIYIYYDGNNENVTTDKFATLAGANIDLTFTVEE